MSVRAVWILNLSKEDYGSVIFNRHFPTVEKKCRAVLGKNYTPLPPAAAFASSLLVTLKLADSKQFVEWRDGCGGGMQLPVVELSVNAQSLWPVISTAQNGLLVCCLPFDESQDRKDLLKSPCVSVGFSVLLGVLDFIGTSGRADHLKLMELDSVLSLSMPFGVPSHLDLPCLAAHLKTPLQKFLKKQPAWKPVEYRGKQVISLRIQEFFRCILGGHREEEVNVEVFGQVGVRADLEGGQNDVSLSVHSVDPSQPLSLESIVLHPCVSLSSGTTTLGSGKRFRFSPPPHDLVLLHYVSSHPREPPLQGVFKMIGESDVELLLQLRLNEKVKNSFDYCDLVLVFFNKGPVKRIESNINYGTLKLSDDKYSLKWNIGSKFPKDLEVKLTAKVEFLEEPFMPNSDPFCVEKNCYVQVNMRQSNATLSGLNIDPKSVTLSEGSRPKILMERSVQSTEYRIWNGYGDVPFPVNASKLFRQICAA